MTAIAGEADVVGFDAFGNMNLDTTSSGWRDTSHENVVGRLIGTGRQQALLYHRNAGEANTISVNASGTLDLDFPGIV